MKLFFLTDYKNQFGSKWGSIPYNSGFDLSKLTKEFTDLNFDIEFVNLHKIQNPVEYSGQYVLYISSEDLGYKYKSYIEDVVYILELNGAIILPAYRFLRANNNKVFMSLLEKNYILKIGHILNSSAFGSLEDLKNSPNKIQYPVVIKKAEGAMSKGVRLAKNYTELIRFVKELSSSKNFFLDFKDKLRVFKHKGYTINSTNRNKFILQEFIPNLLNDWKIIVFGSRYYVLTRHIKGNDFRASGSHYKYLAGSKAILPDGLLNFAKKVFDAFQVPHLSIDVVYDGQQFYLIEFQAVYFGTSTYNMSDVYYALNENKWEAFDNNISIEKVFTDSISSFILK